LHDVRFSYPARCSEMGTQVSIGRVTVAPCGHTGETIIGTYVKCLQGCEGPAELPRRAEIGHVRDCACKGCKIRRVGAYIALKDGRGKIVNSVPWDGTGDSIKATVTVSSVVKHIVILDDQKRIVETGNIDVDIVPGIITIKFGKLLKDGAALIIQQSMEDHLDEALRQLSSFGYGMPGTVITGRAAFGNTATPKNATVANPRPGFVSYPKTP
jgi:hypothetical protein